MIINEYLYSMGIGDIIRNKILEKGVKQAEVARRVNTSPQNLNQMLKSNRRIDVDLLKEISKVLEYDFFSHLSYEVSGSVKGYGAAHAELPRSEDPAEVYKVKDYDDCVEKLTVYKDKYIQQLEQNKHLLERIIELQSNPPNHNVPLAQ